MIKLRRVMPIWYVEQEVLVRTISYPDSAFLSKSLCMTPDVVSEGPFLHTQPQKPIPIHHIP